MTRSGMMLIALLLAGTRGYGAGEALTINVSPAHSFAPANLEVKVRIEPHASNRALEISADSYDFYRSSGIQLDGERAPRSIIYRFRGLPGGNYTVRGILMDGAGRQRARTRQVITVIPTGSEF